MSCTRFLAGVEANSGEDNGDDYKQHEKADGHPSERVYPEYGNNEARDGDEPGEADAAGDGPLSLARLIRWWRWRRGYVTHASALPMPLARSTAVRNCGNWSLRSSR